MQNIFIFFSYIAFGVNLFETLIFICSILYFILYLFPKTHRTHSTTFRMQYNEQVFLVFNLYLAIYKAKVFETSSTISHIGPMQAFANEYEKNC